MEKEFIIKRSFFDNAKRELFINNEFIKFESFDNEFEKYIIFQKEEIEAFKYGVKWYRLYLIFGREYQIFLKNNKNKIIKINFKSYFGRNKSKFNNLFNEIINSIWENHFYYKIDDFIYQINNGKTIEIGEVKINSTEIIIKTSGLLKSKSESINWEDLKTKDYHTYFTIYSSKNPENINRGFQYLNDWNTFLLKSIIYKFQNR